MSEKRTTEFAILGGAVFVLVLILAWRLLRREPTPPTPEELAQIALSDATEEEREKAALELARHPDEPLVLIQKVFHETSSPKVQVAAIYGLGKLRDWESIPDLIELMKGDSRLLRGRAAMAINQIAREDFGFRSNDPPDKQAESIRIIEEKWPVMYEGSKRKKTDPEEIRKEFERRLEEQRSKS